MTLEELIRYYVSILVDVARVDGLYDMAELHQLQAATLTLFDSEEMSIDLSVDDEFVQKLSKILQTGTKRLKWYLHWIC